MEKYIVISEDLLKSVLASEAQKIVGKSMKRFEISDNKDDIKKQVKELIYEWTRDLQDILKANTYKSDKAIQLDFQK
jgi:hypothetical protein